MSLTNIEIKNAQPKDKEYVMSDGSGLVILVKPSGAKLWRYPQGHLHHKRNRITEQRDPCCD